MRVDAVRAIELSVRALLARRDRLVLAVSGGVDSAVLLDAVARLRTPGHRVVVATVDHGSGDVATEATARTLAASARFGLPAISERLQLPAADEATWRAARWDFLQGVAAAERAHIATAHTRDDHIETVVMRVLRGAGARGLAGLLASSAIERPLLEHHRSAVQEYARQQAVAFVDDPTNESLAFFRNRVRHQLLPAIRSVKPGFEDEVLDLSRRAAELRDSVDRVADAYADDPPADTLAAIDADGLQLLPDESLRLLLPSLAARAGITLDRRGVVRLADLVRSGSGVIGQLSGGFEAVRSGTQLLLYRPALKHTERIRLRNVGETRFGGFRFRAEPGARFMSDGGASGSPWRIYIPMSAEPVVRQWHPGDRLTTDLSGGRRRVKRYFADAGVAGPLRAGWPVVLCDDQVIWIPGIKSSQAAVRHGPRMVHYTCERIRD
jgi:tRNA(Ile)-lysidine synthase